MFLNTDNSTAEAALYKGNSSSPKLHALVVRVKLLEVKHSCWILVFHVSGKRMQAQGTDGLSRGTHMDSFSSEEDILSLIPFNLSAIERSSNLKEWIMS